MSSPPYVYCIPEIVTLARTLSPVNALSQGRLVDAQCLTPLIEAVDIGGTVVPLAKLMDRDGTERYGGGYPRVSTLLQQAEGFSIDDQIKNIIKYFVDKGLAFRIFSDAGLSGSLPYNDAALIARMIEAKKELYRSVFQRVFLSPLRLQSYTAAQERSVRQYLERRLAKIEKGRPEADEPGLQLDTRPRTTQKLAFRPGLTRLIDALPHLHTVVVNDLTRLSRNQYLFAEIARKFQQRNTKVVGVMESLDFLNKTDGDSFDIGPELQSWFLAKVAELRLRETVLGDLRGLLERLEQGKSIGSKPCWVQTIPDGPEKDRAELKPGVRETITRLIALFVDEGLGTYELCSALTREGWPCPSKAGVWTYDIVKGILTSRALTGRQCEFGLEFPVFPALIDEDRWQQIQARWNGRDRLPWGKDWQGVRYGGRRTKYLATGLMRCVCAGSINRARGGSMVFKPAPDPRNASYVCGCASRKKGMRHINLQQISVDAFIDGLIASDPAVLFGRFRHTLDYQSLQDALRATEQDLVAAGAKVARRRTELAAEAAEFFRGAGFRTADAGWESLVGGYTASRMETDAAAQEMARLERQRTQYIASLAEYVPPEEVAGIQDRAAQWETLEVWEKNEVLLHMFDHWQFHRLHDSDTDLEMEMVLRGGRALPPVTVITIDRGRNIWRRLPSVQEWVAGVIAAQHSRTSARR